jgi:hypothetical protein
LKAASASASTEGGQTPSLLPPPAPSKLAAEPVADALAQALVADRPIYSPSAPCIRGA